MQINILHTNDIHSNISNLPKLGAYVNGTRIADSETLLVDSGDMITGDFQFKFNQGAAEIEIANYLRYDFVTLGNHDFDLGVDFLKDYMNNIEAQYILSNLLDENNSLGEFKQSYIKEVGGVKVGFLGFILPQITNILGDLNQFELIDINLYQKIIDKLKNEGADIIVALTHQGLDQDIVLAQSTTGIDLIFGGHSHTKLSEPICEGNTYIVQTGSYGNDFGHLTLNVENQKISNVEYSLINAEELEAEDDDLTCIINKYLTTAESYTSEVYGRSSTHLEGRREIITKQSTNLGSLICDSYIHYAKQLGFNPDFALINARGLRKCIEIGDITYRDLYNVMPFEKQLQIIDVKGRDLILALDNIIELQTTNLVVINKREQKRELYDRKFGASIDDEKIYQVATMDYIYDHRFFSNLKNGVLRGENLGLDTDIVAGYIKTLDIDFKYEANGMVSHEEE